MVLLIFIFICKISLFIQLMYCDPCDVSLLIREINDFGDLQYKVILIT